MERNGQADSIGMHLENWDPIRKRWIMYRNQEEHSADCTRYPFDQIPCRIFLDTSVVNLLIKNSRVIFEMEAQDSTSSLTRVQDIEALMHVFAVGARADWTLRTSAKTLDEVRRTISGELRDRLESYVVETLERGTHESVAGDYLGRRVADSTLLGALPGSADRELLGNAIGLGCDAFVTADVKTIVSRRHRLPDLPLRILTPTEWWFQVKPWGGLWL
jgi:hypothetical protein